ncbi:creatininase family protein [Vulcanisaeta thermophila]|uniref:creatininase family protein n=1 Tax=Vulcanisaeta thermophila TaxID=867917 RepID=UPI000853643E|nr:creatininase family protein [Vulcanisaeta thermophila]
MKIAELTYMDVPTESLALIPLGSLEQHGPHLPLGTDAFIAEYVANEVEGAFPDRVLLFPTVFITASMEHVGFRGTAYVGYETLLQYIMDIVRSVSEWCKGGIALINGHGGNVEVLNLVVKKWNYAGNKPRVIHYYIYNKRVMGEINKYFRRFGHADSVETSIIAFINRKLVMWDRVGEVSNWGDVNSRRTMDINPGGVIGELSRDSVNPDLGRIIIETMVNDLIAQLRSEFPEVMGK